jgi:hypothetical protein
MLARLAGHGPACVAAHVLARSQRRPAPPRRTRPPPALGRRFRPAPRQARRRLARFPVRRRTASPSRCEPGCCRPSAPAPRRARSAPPRNRTSGQDPGAARRGAPPGRHRRLAAQHSRRPPGDPMGGPDERSWSARPCAQTMRFCRSSRVTDLNRRKPANEFLRGRPAAPDQRARQRSSHRALGDRAAKPAPSTYGCCVGSPDAGFAWDARASREPWTRSSLVSRGRVRSADETPAQLHNSQTRPGLEPRQPSDRDDDSGSGLPCRVPIQASRIEQRASAPGWFIMRSERADRAARAVTPRQNA